MNTCKKFFMDLIWLDVSTARIILLLIVAALLTPIMSAEVLLETKKNLSVILSGICLMWGAFIRI